MIDYKLFGQRIRQERKKNGRSLQSLAKAVGITTAFMGHLEKGNRSISVPTLVALCNELHVSPNFLLDGLTKEDGPSREVTFARIDVAEPSSFFFKPAADASMSFQGTFRPEGNAPAAVLRESMLDESAFFLTEKPLKKHTSGTVMHQSIPHTPPTFHATIQPESPANVLCESTPDVPASFFAPPTIEKYSPDTVFFDFMSEKPAAFYADTIPEKYEIPAVSSKFMSYEPMPSASSWPDYPWCSPSSSAAEAKRHANMPTASPEDIRSKCYHSDSEELASSPHLSCEAASASSILPEEGFGLPFVNAPSDEIPPPLRETMYEPLLPLWMVESPTRVRQISPIQLLCGMISLSSDLDESENTCGAPPPSPEIPRFFSDLDSVD